MGRDLWKSPVQLPAQTRAGFKAQSGFCLLSNHVVKISRDRDIHILSEHLSWCCSLPLGKISFLLPSWSFLYCNLSKDKLLPLLCVPLTRICLFYSPYLGSGKLYPDSPLYYSSTGWTNMVPSAFSRTVCTPGPNHLIVLFLALSSVY